MLIGGMTTWSGIDVITKAWENAVAIVAIVMFCLLLVSWWPSLRLLRRTIYHDRPLLGSLYAVRELSLCLAWVLYLVKTDVIKGSVVHRAARVWAEVELLHPRPRRSVPEKATLSERLRSRREHFVKLRAWRGRLRGAVRELIGHDVPGQPTIQVETCFDLYRAEKLLTRYFEVLERGRERDPGRFLCTLDIDTAFVAPLHLLTGLVTHFDQDWTPVINEYGRAVTRRADPLEAGGLRRLQTFLFDCWLLWGPSIPVCRCNYWKLGEGGAALQLGYGDENNSFPLFDEKSGLFHRFAELLARVQEDHAKSGRPVPLALQVHAKLRPRWGPSIDDKDVCTAQQAIRGGVVLECEDLGTIGGSVSKLARTYYSAYLWVMFVILDEHGLALFPEKDAKIDSDLGEAWRGVLPFFEHGNVADGDAYVFHKEQLARKALAGLQKMVQASPALRFAYACAMDDPACSPAGINQRRFPDPNPEIRQLLETALPEPQFEELRKSGRLSIAPNRVPAYSACQLPRMIRAYYAAVDRRGKEEGAEA
jgi:hypothetical protein